MGRAARSEGRSLAAWVWFAAWAIVGAVTTLGFVSFALWLFLIPIGIGGAFLLAMVRPTHGSPWGLLSGAGLSLLVIAYVQRDGPGTTCWRSASGGGCTEHLDPRPWLAAGIVFVLSGVALYLVSRRSRHDAPSVAPESIAG